MKRNSLLIFLVSMFVLVSSSLTEAYETVHTKEQSTSSWGIGTHTSDTDSTLTYFIFKNYESKGQAYYQVKISCEKKKLEVLASGFDLPIEPKTDSKGYGFTQVKIDTSKSTSYKYLSWNDSYSIKILSPKAFTTALLKGKTKATFKIESLTAGHALFDISIADLKKYESKFKSLGCPLR